MMEFIRSSVILQKILISFSILILGMIGQFILRMVIFHSIDRIKISENRRLILKKIFRTSVFVLIFLSMMAVWIKDPWTFLVGIFGMIAIAFFAVWSLLSNIVAGLLLILSKPFGLNDTILIIPDDVEGIIVDFDFTYVRLEDKDGNKINIPNSIIMQRIIKVIKKQAG